MNNNQMINILKNGYRPSDFCREVRETVSRIEQTAKRATGYEPGSPEDEALMEEWWEAIASVTVSADIMKRCIGVEDKISALRTKDLEKRVKAYRAVLEHGTATIKPGAVRKVMRGNRRMKAFSEKSLRRRKGKG